ncbi:MAG: hypothetical protein F6K19_30875 [Cyanothece sp. SIO1E1]|nr:hypothetical protein [Cyanothece sp. SIO1E1]
MGKLRISVEVPQCEICGKTHEFSIVARTLRLFGGNNSEGPPKQASATYEVIVVCPVEDKDFKIRITIPRPDGEKIVAVKQKKTD